MNVDQLPDMLTADEVAELLRVNRKTVYEAAKRGDIPGTIRLGRVLRFRRDEVLGWTGQGRAVPEGKGRR